MFRPLFQSGFGKIHNMFIFKVLVLVLHGWETKIFGIRFIGTFIVIFWD